ncbi:multidrug DMT transporter permease [Crenothrix sp. D3]|nr:multidrug DMT transporter permease [Crenothrix sp. D3]
MIKNQRLMGCILVLLGAAGFSTKAILIKLAYAADGQLDAITLLALRMLFALPMFLIAAVWHQKKSAEPALNKKQWGIVIILGLMGYYIASYLDFLGLQTISAGLERLIIFSYPTFVVLFSALYYRRALTASVMIALGLSYIGILLVFIESLSLTSTNIVLGSAYVLSSALIFSVFVMGSGVMVHRIGSVRFTAYTMTVASIATLTHFAFHHDLVHTVSTIPLNVYVLSLIMAIFATVLPSFLMNNGIKKVGARSAAILSSVGPIITLALANSLLQENITNTQLLGTFFVLAGGLVVGRMKA